MRKRTLERIEFLSDALTCGIWHDGYGQFELVTDNIDFTENSIWDREHWFADIRFYGEREIHRITIDTIAKGIGVIRNAIPATDDDGFTYLVNPTTFERVYVGEWIRDTVLTESAENECCNFDVVCGMAVIECALFGKVVYA
jgi:hypothetical protein